MKKQGNLYYDEEQGRIDIRFGLDDFYGGLHCGETMDVLINKKWFPTRIEMNVHDEWYLEGVKTKLLNGLVVRI